MENEFTLFSLTQIGNGTTEKEILILAGKSPPTLSSLSLYNDVCLNEKRAEVY